MEGIMKPSNSGVICIFQCHHCRRRREILIVCGAVFGLVAAVHITVHRGYVLGWVIGIRESSTHGMSTNT
jgi:hypothetical protein